MNYGYSRPFNRPGWSPRTWSTLAWIGGGIVGALLGLKFAKPTSALARGSLGFLGGALTVGMIGDKFIENNHPDSKPQGSY